MLSAATLIFAAQASSVVYPAAAVLAAFGEVCRPITTIEGAVTAAKAVGWETFEPDPASPAGELLAFGESEDAQDLVKKAGGNPANNELLIRTALRRTVADEELVVLFSGWKVGDRLINQCGVHDFDELHEIPVAAAEEWMKRSPDQASGGRVIHTAMWRPGYAAGHAAFSLHFIPPGSPAIQLVKSSGISLTADLHGAAH